MLKTLFVYILVIAGIAGTMGLSGASHVKQHALQQWEQQQ